MAQSKDLFANVGFDRQFFDEFPAERCFQVFAVMDLPSGKLPLQPVTVCVVTLADKDRFTIQ